MLKTLITCVVIYTVNSIFISSLPSCYSQDQIIQLTDQRRVSLYRSYIPVTDDKDLNELLQSDELLFYTEREMPRAFQMDWAGRTYTTAQDPRRNVSADPSDSWKVLGGNANVDFPWAHPGGLDRSRNTTTIKFMILPRGPLGRRKPVVYWLQRIGRSNNQVGYVWRFPRGTIFGEVIMLHDSNGQYYTFEMRIRERTERSWAVRIFRPFGSARELNETIIKFNLHGKVPGQVTEEQINYVNTHYRRENHYYDAHRTNRFSSVAVDYMLPNYSDEVVRILLTSRMKPFSDVGGTTWTPTSQKEFNIVPKEYFGAALGSDDKSCMECHKSTLMHADDFDRVRGWYGFVRGSDGIISFHPFDPSCINWGGMNPISIRQSLESNGIVTQFNPSVHDRRDYVSLEKH